MYEKTSENNISFDTRYKKHKKTKAIIKLLELFLNIFFQL